METIKQKIFTATHPELGSRTCMLVAVINQESHKWISHVTTQTTNKFGLPRKTTDSVPQEDFNRSVSFGLAIMALEEPKHNWDLAIKIASGRAKKKKSRLGIIETSDKTMLGEKMVNLLMGSQVSYIQEHFDQFLRSNGKKESNIVKSVYLKDLKVGQKFKILELEEGDAFKDLKISVEQCLFEVLENEWYKIISGKIIDFNGREKYTTAETIAFLPEAIVQVVE